MVRVLAALVALFALAMSAAAQPRASGTVILSTTTSTQDSGLLDVLVPVFERQTGYTVKTIPVGTGQALTLAARGEADVTLAHAPALEKKYVSEGKMLNRRVVMYNDFLIAGPEVDPAGIRGEKSATAALRKIAAAGARFVSRGDKSGTHILEQALWRDAGAVPAAPGTSSRLGRGDARLATTASVHARIARRSRSAAGALVVCSKVSALAQRVLGDGSTGNGRASTRGLQGFADSCSRPPRRRFSGP